jgi:hypothetical protein
VSAGKVGFCKTGHVTFFLFCVLRDAGFVCDPNDTLSLKTNNVNKKDYNALDFEVMCLHF